MKPDRRRLLIPGLLIALLLVVALAATLRRAGAESTPTPVPYVATTEVATIHDSRITESSGLAASLAHPGIAYTINDSGHAPRIYAIKVATGKVVGVTTVRNVTWRDTEAMGLFGGILWIADTGNNSRSRTDFAVYGLAEPGTGDHDVGAARYPVAFPAGPINIEAMAIVGGRIELYNKGWPSGGAFALPTQLSATEPNTATLVPHPAPAFTTDAATTPDGRHVLLRTPASVEVHDSATWVLVRADAIPPNERGETITVEPSGRSYLVGSEGSDSKLLRVKLSPASFKAGAKPIDVPSQIQAAMPVRTLIWRYRTRLAALLAVAALGSTVLIVWWRRRPDRRR